MRTARPYTRSATSTGSRTHSAIPLPCLPIDFCAEQSRLKRMNGWGLRLCYGRSFAIHTRLRSIHGRDADWCAVAQCRVHNSLPEQPPDRTSDGEHLLWAEFVCHTNLHVQKGVVNWTSSGKPVWTVY